MKRIFAVVAAAVVMLGLTAGASGPLTAPAAAQDDAVTYDGLAGIRLGEPRGQLESEHGMTQGPGDCSPRLPEHPQVSPVFHDGRLVLLWADAPLHTPEGITVGTPVDSVLAAYPGAQALTADPHTYRFDGLLATSGDRAYLFLHDGEQVQKVILGYADYAQLLFHEGFGTC